MRESTKYQKSNAYVISAQLDEASHARLLELMRLTGFSKSRLIKVLIMGASVRRIMHIKTEGKM